MVVWCMGDQKEWASPGSHTDIDLPMLFLLLVKVVVLMDWYEFNVERYGSVSSVCDTVSYNYRLDRSRTNAETMKWGIAIWGIGIYQRSYEIKVCTKGILLGRSS